MCQAEKLVRNVPITTEHKYPFILHSALPWKGEMQQLVIAATILSVGWIWI